MPTSDAVTVGVLLDTQFGYGMEILQGVRDHAARHPSWQVLALHSTQERLLDELLRQGQLGGVIGALLSDRWLEGLPGRPIPMVNVGDTSELRLVASVLPDNRLVGRQAARHLLENGQRVFGCVCESASIAARQRRDGFVTALREAGFEVAEPPPLDSPAPDAVWPDWLAGLSRPCALFCGSDFLARRLVARIRLLGGRVPEEFAVVGVGDSALDSILAGVSLSSVVLPGRRIGLRAAARLEGLLRGEGGIPVVERIVPDGVVVRASSAVVPGADPLVARALALMQQQPSRPLGTETLARRCGASRRTLELRFRRALGRGPASEQRRRRLELACRLLSEGGLSLTAVAEATGFGSQAHFSAAFRRAYGRPPGAWRSREQIQ